MLTSEDERPWKKMQLRELLIASVLNQNGVCSRNASLRYAEKEERSKTARTV
jgi:hypothetical protein